MFQVIEVKVSPAKPKETKAKAFVYNSSILNYTQSCYIVYLVILAVLCETEVKLATNLLPITIILHKNA